jgi:hypothetical protein
MSVNQITQLDKERRPLSGPPIAFFAALAVTAAAAGTASTIHADYVFPLAASLCLTAAAAIALFGWRKAKTPSAISYLDVAGALILIGLAVAALIDPAQLLRITGTAT